MLIAEKQVSQAEALHCCVPHTNRYTFIDGHPVFEALIVEILFREVPGIKDTLHIIIFAKSFPCYGSPPLPPAVTPNLFSKLLVL